MSQDCSLTTAEMDAPAHSPPPTGLSGKLLREEGTEKFLFPGAALLTFFQHPLLAKINIKLASIAETVYRLQCQAVY